MPTPQSDTQSNHYASRLEGFDQGWRRWLNVQRPYRWNIRRLGLGFTLDLGCGVGRNLLHLGGKGAGVGIDHSIASVDRARRRGLEAFTPNEFVESPYAKPEHFNSLLLAHVIEHMRFDEACTLIRTHLQYIKRGGQVVILVPQEAGFRSDSTHVEYFRRADLLRVATACHLRPVRMFSFPFPAIFGKMFRYNETILVARIVDDTAPLTTRSQGI